MLDRRTFVGSAAAAATLSHAGIAAQPRARPNILFIMADDLGYADLGCYGRGDIATPHIDSLARDGLLFTNAYSCSSVCSPTRVGLITGRYPGRFPAGLDEPLAMNPELGLDPATPTFVRGLRELGYQTSLVGKWHLGSKPRSSPLRLGYERFFGIRTGAADYFTHLDFEGKADLWEGDIPVEKAGYMTDLLGERAAAEVTRMASAERPFLLSLHFTAPHWPWETDRDEAMAPKISSLQHYDGGSLASYRAMIEAMDRAIGRVLGAVDTSGKSGDTMVVFTSDNGGERFSNVWPFSGRKGELLEGGIRVPQLLRWPRMVQAGARSDEPMISMDWAATFFDAAGVAPTSQSALDGVSILPRLSAGPAPARSLFWRYKAHDQKAVRRGRFKYLSIGGEEYLFDIVADPLERANLSQREKPVFEGLRDQWRKWNATMLPYPAKSFSMDNKKRHMPDRY